METDSLQIDTRRLGHAWNCIIPAHFEMCANYTRDNGAGISVFRLVPQAEAVTGDNPSNCAYNFMTRENAGWDATFQHAPNKEKLLAKYDPSRHVIISVHIPAVEGKDNTVGNIRLFENALGADGQPIEIETDSVVKSEPN